MLWFFSDTIRNYYWLVINSHDCKKYMKRITIITTKKNCRIRLCFTIYVFCLLLLLSIYYFSVDFCWFTFTEYVSNKSAEIFNPHNIFTIIIFTEPLYISCRQFVFFLFFGEQASHFFLCSVWKIITTSHQIFWWFCQTK